MAGAQISTSVTIISNLKGFMALSLNNYSTSAAAAICAGSVVEVNGAYFQFPSDETPSDWSTISDATQAYIAVAPSGTAGSQVLTAYYTATAPTWRDDLQGWYTSAASTVRVVASVYRIDTDSYYPKHILEGYQRTNPFAIASVSGALSISGNTDVTGTLSVTSSIACQGPIFGEGYRLSDSQAVNAATSSSILFSALSPFIPVTNDTILLSGGYGPYIAVSAYRYSSTQIRIDLFSTSAGGVWDYIIISSGSTALSPMALSW